LSPLYYLHVRIYLRAMFARPVPVSPCLCLSVTDASLLASIPNRLKRLSLIAFPLPGMMYGIPRVVGPCQVSYVVPLSQQFASCLVLIPFGIKCEAYRDIGMVRCSVQCSAEEALGICVTCDMALSAHMRFLRAISYCASYLCISANHALAPYLLSSIGTFPRVKRVETVHNAACNRQ
jgi:hypothetical protein